MDGYHHVRNGIIALLLAHHIHIRHPVRSSHPCFANHAFKAVGMALSSAGGQIIIMEHIQKWAFIRNILGCILCVLLNYFLIPQYGIIGSSYVTIITVLFTGCFANLLIPTYHNVMKLQLYAILLGWKELRYFKRMIRK